MDKIILDFQGERVEIPSNLSVRQVVSEIGMKIRHNGYLYQVFDRHVEGVDEVAEEFASRLDSEEPLKKELTLVVVLRKI